MKKLLILRFPYESRYGGEEQHTIQIAEGLRKKGCTVFFAGNDSVLLEEMRIKGFFTQKIWGPKPPVTKKTLFSFGVFSFFFCLRMLPLLIRYRCKGVRTVYCLSLTEKLTCTFLARLCFFRVVWVEHARIGRWLTRNPYLPLYWVLAHLTGGVVFTSDLAFKKAPWIPHGKVIPCGINIDEFDLVPRYELPHSAPSTYTIGVIARFSTDKGVAVFLRAAALIHQKWPHVLFVCCGDGPEEENLRQLAQTLGIAKVVLFLKNISRTTLGSLYKRLDCVVLPSTDFDPFGLVPGEAMALGKPVIITTVCGIAGYMNNGEHGLIVQPGDVPALTMAIERFLKDPFGTKKIAAAGQKLIMTELNETKLIDRFYQVLFI